MARSKARKIADLLAGGSALEDGVITAAEVTGLGTAATTAASASGIAAAAAATATSAGGTASGKRQAAKGSNGKQGQRGQQCATMARALGGDGDLYR